MIDHLGEIASDYAASKRFYVEALKPLGDAVTMDWGKACLIPDATRQGTLWVGEGPKVVPYHFAFAAPDRATVRAFHRAALAAGGRDNGAPGLRPQYYPAYYGAFVLDPEGYNVEAVCHRPE